MRTPYLLPLALLYSHTACAGLVEEFKHPNGDTNWQHVSNWSGGILIVLLSITVINLFFTRRAARKSNLALKAIRNELELRVRERTATLDESNRLLKQTNQLLEQEIAGHVATTTRLRSSESYIANILQSMPLMLIGLNKDGQITQWNRRAEDITGVSAAQATGKNLWEVYPAITVSPAQIRRATDSNQAITIKHSQRGQYYFDITIYPLRDQIETGVVILIDDVTRKVLAENMLIHSDKMASMGELAAAMAQDINTPLQAMLFDLNIFEKLLAAGNLNLNESANETDAVKLTNVLSDAAEKGQHVASIVRNLQAFARGRNEKKQLSHIPDVLEHTLELAADMLSVPVQLRFRDIAIVRQYENDLPAVPCYITELQQVFLSLFRHVCDAFGNPLATGHTPTMTIQINKNFDALWIRIHHNGRSLSSEEQMYIFEPYFGNKSPDDNFDAGKRLSFPYFIITEQHQGQMAVTSDPETGTTFHIQLQLGTDQNGTYLSQM